MIRAARLLIALVLLTTLAACGGGGGGGGGNNGGGGGNNVTGISITPSTLTFTANHDDPGAPPAQTITITALGSGTTYIRGENGTLTGLTCNGTSSCTYDVRPTEAPYNFVTPGTTTNGLTFIGCADQTCTTGAVPNGRQTVTYTYTITPGTDFSPSTPLTVNGVEGVAPAPQAIALAHPSGTVPPLHATFTPTGAGPNFVTLTPAATATATSSPAALQAQFAALPAGTYTGTIDVQPGTSPRRARRDVTYVVQSALSATGTTPFVIDTSTTSGGLQQTLTLAARAGAGVLGWTATGTAPWLQLSRTTGDTLAGNQVVVSLVPAQLERLPKGLYNTAITFAPTTPAAFAAVTVTISVDMRLPGTEFIMPHAVGEGTTSDVFIRGSGFATLPGTVKFGNADSAPPPTRDGDTLIRANPPATLTAPGSYKIDLAIPANALALNRERARLAVVNTATTVTQPDDVALPVGPKYAAVFDDARLTLYVANVADASTPASASEVDTLAWNGSGWTPGSFTLPFLRDLIQSAGGDELLALTSTEILRIDPVTGSVIDRVTVPSPGGVPNRSFAVGNDGRMLISQATNIGVSTNITYFDPNAAAFLDEFLCCISRNIRASGDGAAIYLLGDGPVRRYDVKARTYTDSGPTSLGGKVLSVARAGARFVVDGTHVFNGDLSSRGTLAVGGETLKAAAITADGTRAYAYGTDGVSTSTLHKFDLETFNGSGGFAELGTGIPLPHMVASPVMTISVDGRTVFIAGDDRVIVRPVAP